MATHYTDCATNNDMNTEFFSTNSPLPIDKGSEKKAFASEFDPSSFLIPGWKGESLLSRSALVLHKIQNQLWQDAVSQFQNHPNFNQSLQKGIHREFLSFAKHYEIQGEEFESGTNFWRHFYDESSPYRKQLDYFVQQFCFKAVTLYLYKVRLIVIIESENLASITDKALLNPHSFFARLFGMGGQRELVCESLQFNIYSWYHPSASYARVINTNAKLFSCLSTTELTILTKFSWEKYIPTESLHPSFFHKDESYSHSLSHKSMGLLLNILMVFAPIWKKQDEFSYPHPSKGTHPKVLNTKFAGDFLNALSNSHWLAQEHNQDVCKSEILCPSFISNDFENGKFLRCCHELQFLTFLVRYSKDHDSNPLDFIAKVMREKYNNSISDVSGQQSLFSRYDLKKKILYDRIVLNLCRIPKTNPHHFLISQISRQKSSLGKDGHLLVMTNQKLFVPSQSSKIQQLLKDFKLELILEMEELKGKGEIPHYIYTFSHANRYNASSVLQEGIDHSSNVHTFRWRGDIVPFEKFKLYIDELNRFFRQKNSISTPLYQSNPAPNLYFEFHQDAILDGGILLSSKSKDSFHITHPTFFKNLTESCSPFDQFFSTGHLDSPSLFEVKSSLTIGLLGATITHEQQFPLVLIVNYSNPSRITLEIIGSKSYQAKFEQYGQAFYKYFGLIPKHPGLNINLFREFFSTDLGLQIIQISLQGSLTKQSAKQSAKLNALLVPNFFSETTEIPSPFREKNYILSYDYRQLKETHPENISAEWNKAKNLLAETVHISPWARMSLLANFKFNITKALESSQNHSDKQSCFNNRLIREALLRLESYPVYPKNEDVYLEFNVVNQEELHHPLAELSLKPENRQYVLSLEDEEKQTILRLHSEPEFLEFIQYILSSAIGYPISSLIKNLYLPKLTQFQEILRNYTMMDHCLKEILKELTTLIVQMLTHQIRKS